MRVRPAATILDTPITLALLLFLVPFLSFVNQTPHIVADVSAKTDKKNSEEKPRKLDPYAAFTLCERQSNPM